VSGQLSKLEICVNVSVGGEWEMGGGGKRKREEEGKTILQRTQVRLSTFE